MLFKAIRGLGR